MFKDLLVLGAGSAGLLAALAVKRTMPQVAVRVVRSPEIGVIGVGESTTPNIPKFLFQFLGLDHRVFFQLAEPTWKLGIHFFWGRRPCFEYPFVAQLDARWADLPRPNGYYCDEDFTAVNLASALMGAGKAFARQSAGGGPDMGLGHAFHLENHKFVKCLEAAAVKSGIEFIDGTLAGVEKAEQGIAALVLEDGRRLEADFFIDASGFRGELLGRAMAEPFISFSKSLFNDRAILGTWERTVEPTLPYTTAETMDNGWCWRIDHERHINRGYVFSSSHASDEQAREEFARKNPHAKISDRIVRFRTGRLQRVWVDNVMAIGNSCGFVEPLEATSLMLICWQLQTFIEMVRFVGPTPAIRDLVNSLWANAWDDVRDFLTLHFKINDRLDTPYWRHCRTESNSSGLGEILDFYQANGPTGFTRYTMRNRESQFGVEGYLVQLVGNQVPYRNRHTPSAAERQRVERIRAENRFQANSGMTVEQCLAAIRHPSWRWYSEMAGNGKSA